MVLGLLILGTLFGFVSASIGLLTGQVGLLAAFGLYSASGTISVLIGTIFVACRPEDDGQVVGANAVCTRTVAR